MTSAAADSLQGDARRGGERPAMSTEQFARWAELVETRTGMVVPAERKSFLVTGVGLRMREVGFTDYDAYYEFLSSGRAGRLEWAALVDNLTVQETRFFRDGNAVALLESEFLPDVARHAAAGESVQAWSAGCATGEEAYTLAMLLERHLAQSGERPYYGVTGSDISLRALAVAREASYPARRRESLPAPYAEHCTESMADGRFRVVDSVRRRVCFTQMNLLEDRNAPLPAMDLVYCQNVLIYFDRDRRRRILDHLAARLKPGGLMILGAGEALGWTAPGMVRAGTPNVLAYRRTGSPGRVQ